MQTFANRVAVITGGASGIGFALAEQAAQEGMRVVLADVEAVALTRAADTLAANGAAVLAVPCDVSQVAQVEDLARRTLEVFGSVDLLCNNAGVAAGSSIWESSAADWEWVLGVNLWGVIHALRTFVPLMLQQGTEGHIVNTASVAGLVSYHPSASYHVSKHAVVALSEQLAVSLQLRRAPIKASVLCPGEVQTRIMDAERNRPAHLRAATPPRELAPAEAQAIEAMRQVVAAGLSPERVAQMVFAAIRAEQFYILTHSDHPELMQYIRARAEGIIRAGEEVAV
jgi:NAD(P)-dependent dehydrogenase (short-subunit alcohol dehydrogenase family)